jgi:hypothetical protein
MNRRTFLLALPPLLASTACDDFNCAPDEKETSTGCRPKSGMPQPTPIPPAPVASEIEFRVLGDVRFDPGEIGAVILYGSQEEGLSRIISRVPWFASSKTFRERLFLTLTAEATGTGFLHVQVIVNGILFREANTFGSNPRVSIAGLFVK